MAWENDGEKPNKQVKQKTRQTEYHCTPRRCKLRARLQPTYQGEIDMAAKVGDEVDAAEHQRQNPGAQ